MAARKQSVINLLPQDEFDDSSKGKLLHWLLNTFRYIVIVTELVVVGAFLSRFYFDSKIADLNDEIRQKSDYIGSFAKFEEDFRDTQTKTNIVAQMTQDSKLVSPVFADIVSRLPQDTALTQLTVNDGGKSTIAGTALSDNSIQQLLVNLEASQYLENVVITQIETKQNVAAINFSFSADLKGTTTQEEVIE